MSNVSVGMQPRNMATCASVATHMVDMVSYLIPSVRLLVTQIKLTHVEVCGETLFTKQVKKLFLTLLDCTKKQF